MFNHADVTILRIGTLNVRGIKHNTHFPRNLLDQLDICCFQELWLHEYEVDVLDNLHSDFFQFSILPPSDDDVVFCAPRIQRGHGGVSILWRKTLPITSRNYLPFPPTGVQLFPLIMISSFESYSVLHSQLTALNTSDHLPLCCDLSFPKVSHLPPQSVPAQKSSLNWK